MKKYLLLTLCLYCIFETSSNAQVKIHDNGYISVQTTATPLSPISINCAGNAEYYTYLTGEKNALYVKTTGNTSNWGVGADFSNYSTSNNFMVGLRSETRTPGWVDISRGRSFGVMGLAGYATSGWNYGIFGRIHGNNNGAAVYGTVTEAENGVYIDGKYAGYFNGNTRVTGKLTVNGSIQGTVLTSSANTVSTQALSETDDDVYVSDKIKNLNIVSYYKPLSENLITTYSSEDTLSIVPELSEIEKQDINKMHYGIIAEQLEYIYPDLVYENEDGSKSINYIEMIPLLLKSINELNAKIENLESKSGNGIKAKTTSISNITDSGNIMLGTNSPNPFKTSTAVKVYIPDNINDAFIGIYDLNGKQVEKIAIKDRGYFTITISSEKLQAGMYLYSLIADNRIISTKRMVAVK